MQYSFSHPSPAQTTVYKNDNVVLPPAEPVLLNIQPVLNDCVVSS